MSPENRARVTRAGGLAVSKDKDHMAEIGRKGGLAVSRDRDYMAKLGRKGGSSPKTRSTKASKTKGK
jgi:general stress protein YciG